MADYTLGTAEGKIKLDYDGKGISRARDDLGRFTKGGGGGGGGSLAGASDGMQQLATTTGIAAAAIAGGIALAVNSAIQFEKQISAIGAVSGASADQLETLRRKALQLGADTAFSASEAALAMEELVKAGLSVEDVLNGAADATVALAAAGQISLPAAAAIASNAMNQFKLAASDLPRIADLIAGAANSSAIDVGDFGFALSQAGAVANLVGVSFDDLATAIALMGNQGIKGSDAGTSLKTMLQNLQPTTARQIKLMKELGIVTANGTNRFFDQKGSLKSLTDVAGILNGALDGMTDAQKAMALETIFGTDAIRAAAVLAGEGADGFSAMAAAMGEVSAQEVAEKRLDNVAGALEQLKGSTETAAIAFGTALLPVIRKVAEFVTMLVNRFTALDPKWQKLIAFAAVAAVAFLGLIAAVAAVGAVIAGLAASLIAVKLGAIIGAIVLTLVAIAAGIKLAYDRSQTFRDVLAQLGQVARNVFSAMMEVIRPLIAFFKNSFLPAVKEVAAGLQKNLEPALKAIGEFLKTRILPAVERFKEAMIKLMPTIISVGKIILGIAKVAFTVLGKVLGFIIPLLLKLIGPVFTALVNVISFIIELIPKLIGWFKSFINVITTIGKVIGVAVIAPLLGIYLAGKWVFEQLMKVVNAFIDHFMAVWNFIAPVVKAVFGLISAIIGAALDVIVGIFRIWSNVLRAVWDAIWKFLIAPVINAFNAIVNHVKVALDILMGFISAAWAVIRAIWDKVWGWIVVPIINAFNAIKDQISNRLEEAKKVVGAAWDVIVKFFASARDKVVTIINGFSAFVDKVRAFFTQARDAATQKLTELIAWVKGLPDKILSAIGNLGSTLYNAGKALIQGFWNGLKAVWDSMQGWVENKMSGLRNLWPFSPAKTGPFSGRGWVLYSGRALMEGFAQGMDERVGMVTTAAEHALAGIAGRLPTDFSASVSAGQGALSTFAPSGSSGGSETTTNHIEIIINANLEDLKQIKDVQDLLDWIDRMRNDSRRGVEVG